jgi:hypothetical protein
VAGWLAHFITDLANPLHTTIHSNGWRTGFPNPHHFTGEDIHRRFETDYVNAAIEEKDFQDLVGPTRLLTAPWLEAAMAHARASHQHLEEVYALDDVHSFGEGSEPAKAKRFTCERLADAARALRDFWYAAWIRSGPLATQARAEAAQAGSTDRRTSR